MYIENMVSGFSFMPQELRSLQVSASLVNLSLAYGALGDLKGQAPLMGYKT